MRASSDVVVILQSEFVGNTAASVEIGQGSTVGGGIYFYGTNNVSYLINSSVIGNFSTTNIFRGTGVALSDAADGSSVHIENSIIARNSERDNDQLTLREQLYPRSSRLSVAWSCMEADGGSPVGTTNRVVCRGGTAACGDFVGSVDATRTFPIGEGNVRLTSQSPCIDIGNNFVDVEPQKPQLQLLPPTDLDGEDRIVDGDGDRTATVDAGAYEYVEQF